jgi:hypothetical protein
MVEEGFMTREEAIEWLRTMGVEAWKRDWSIGASIGIPVGEPRGGGGITCWDNILYLYPDREVEGSWGLLLDLYHCVYYPDLETAVRAALQHLADLEKSSSPRDA